MSKSSVDILLEPLVLRFQELLDVPAWIQIDELCKSDHSHIVCLFCFDLRCDSTCLSTYKDALVEEKSTRTHNKGVG